MARGARLARTRGGRRWAFGPAGKTKPLSIRLYVECLRGEEKGGYQELRLPDKAAYSDRVFFVEFAADGTPDMSFFPKWLSAKREIFGGEAREINMQ